MILNAKGRALQRRGTAIYNKGRKMSFADTGEYYEDSREMYWDYGLMKTARDCISILLFEYGEYALEDLLLWNCDPDEWGFRYGERYTPYKKLVALMLTCGKPVTATEIRLLKEKGYWKTSTIAGR